MIDDNVSSVSSSDEPPSSGPDKEEELSVEDPASYPVEDPDSSPGLIFVFPPSKNRKVGVKLWHRRPPTTRTYGKGRV